MTFTGTLYPYQEEAAQLVIDEMRVLIAYEMGLGKTPITIAALEFLAEGGQLDSGIIVCLSSLKYQWLKAIERFTCTTCHGKLDHGEDDHAHEPSALGIVIDGTPKQRAEQYERARSGDYRYILVNYEQVVNDWKEIRRLPRDFVVADEVTAVKSFRSQRSRRMKRMQAPYIIGLTGTPMENGKLEEVYSIMQFINEQRPRPLRPVRPDVHHPQRLRGRAALPQRGPVPRDHGQGLDRSRRRRTTTSPPTCPRC